MVVGLPLKPDTPFWGFILLTTESAIDSVYEPDQIKDLIEIV